MAFSEYLNFIRSYKIDSIQNSSTILMPLNSELVVVHATLLQKLLSFKFCRFSFDFLRDDRSKNHRNYSRHFHVRSAEKITNEICCVWCCYLIRKYKIKRQILTHDLLNLFSKVASKSCITQFKCKQVVLSPINLNVKDVKN